MNRRGFILAAALLVVVLIAVLVSGVFFATIEESHIANSAVVRDRALSAAEAAIDQEIGNWSNRAGQPIGVAGEELSTWSSAGMSVDITITRLDSTLYSIVAQARSPSSTSAAMRRIGVLVSTSNSVNDSILVDPIPERWWYDIL